MLSRSIRYLYNNKSEVGFIKKEITYIYLNSIVNEGEYLSGKSYIKKRCSVINIEIYFSDCIKLDDLKNKFIPRTNGIHKRKLLLFVDDLEDELKFLNL